MFPLDDVLFNPPFSQLGGEKQTCFYVDSSSHNHGSVKNACISSSS